VLLEANFGTPVSKHLCIKQSRNIGITSTPVIDPVAKLMYAIVYTQTSGGPAYYIHAVNLGSLTDEVAPVPITATHTLSDGTTDTFNATVQRQRPGLVLANGNVYAGFGSFCDEVPSESRGWVLGWQTGTLTPLAGNQITDSEATSPNTYFLSSVWMAGYGLAADDGGNILFATGNSDPSGTTYNGVTNIQESVVSVSPNLTAINGLFTPDNQPSLDAHDVDFGSGGVMLLPAQSGSVPYLAVAAGKNGEMYLMNEQALGAIRRRRITCWVLTRSESAGAENPTSRTRGRGVWFRAVAERSRYGRSRLLLPIPHPG